MFKRIRTVGVLSLCLKGWGKMPGNPMAFHCNRASREYDAGCFLLSKCTVKSVVCDWFGRQPLPFELWRICWCKKTPVWLLKNFWCSNIYESMSFRILSVGVNSRTYYSSIHLHICVYVHVYKTLKLFCFFGHHVFILNETFSSSSITQDADYNLFVKYFIWCFSFFPLTITCTCLTIEWIGQLSHSLQAFWQLGSLSPTPCFGAGAVSFSGECPVPSPLTCPRVVLLFLLNILTPKFVFPVVILE